MRVEFSSRVLALPLRTYRRPSNASFCAGIWKCDANKAGQVFSAKERFVGGIRNPEGLNFDTSGRFVGLPSEEVLIVKNGAWYGWPQCFFDPDRMKLVLAPEYGGDGGKKTGDCDMAELPVAVCVRGGHGRRTGRVRAATQSRYATSLPGRDLGAIDCRNARPPSRWKSGGQRSSITNTIAKARPISP